MTHVRFSAVTHVGKVRKVNEDAILALPEQKIWAVSDGMGGHARGDYASQTVVDSLAMLQPGLSPGEMMTGVRDAVDRAHQTISKTARENNATIGATVVTFLVADEHFAAFWCGDSRLYRLQNNGVELLTTDHSMVSALVLSGQITWDEAEQHPEANAVTQAVGVGDEIDLEKIHGEVLPGDRFLLCSDGLSKYATFDMLERTLRREPIETVASALLQIALDGGGADNISVIVVDLI